MHIRTAGLHSDQAWPEQSAYWHNEAELEFAAGHFDDEAQAERSLAGMIASDVPGGSELPAQSAPVRPLQQAHRRIARVYRETARLLSRQGHPAEAAHWYEQAGRERGVGGHPRIAASLRNTRALAQIAAGASPLGRFAIG
jgi:hypothetical protein